MTISSRSHKINPSQTLSISTLSNQLMAQGKDVINLSVGQPNFATPEYAKQAAIEAIKDNLTRYTAVDGTQELKQAIIDKFKRENNLDYSSDQIIASNGAKHSLSLVCQALLDAGDEVIIPCPFWTSYPEMIKLSEGKPVAVMADINKEFKIGAEQLQESITAQTKMLMINSPNNPTGACYTKQELEQLGEVLRQHPHVYICSDDIYEHFVYAGDGKPLNILNVCPDLYDRAIIINGVSKVYSMTGWRIGYAAGPKEVIAAMKKIQSQTTSNPCSISQVASAAALNGPQSHLQFVRSAFLEQRNLLVESLQKIEGIAIEKPAGSFYAFADCSELLEVFPHANDDLSLSEYLLNTHYVATVPGCAFGAENHLRMSFSLTAEKIQQAVEVLKTALHG